MQRLLLLMGCCVALAFLSQRFSIRDGFGKFRRKDRVFFLFLSFLVIIFAGMRTGYNDTSSYIHSFLEIPRFPDVLSGLEWNLGSNPLFMIFTSVIRTMTNDYHTYLVICAILVYFPILSFIRRYSVSYGFSVYLFFAAGYFLFALAAIKQTLATAIALLAIQCYFNKKRMIAVLLLVASAMIHPYVLMFLFVPILLRQIPWTRATYFLIAATIIVSFSFNWLVGTIINMTDILGEGYSEEHFIGEGVNFFRVTVYFVPVILSLVFRRRLFADSSPQENFFVNGTIVGALIMFVGMFGNANMFARLAMYFDPLQLIALPWILRKVQNHTKVKYLTFFAVFGYFGYFIYMTVISKPFGDLFKYISFWEYLRNLFS